MTTDKDSVAIQSHDRLLLPFSEAHFEAVDSRNSAEFLTDNYPPPPRLFRSPRIISVGDRLVGKYRPLGEGGWVAGYCISRDHGSINSPVRYSCYSKKHLLRPLRRRTICKRTHRVRKGEFYVRHYGGDEISPSLRSILKVYSKNC